MKNLILIICLIIGITAVANESNTISFDMEKHIILDPGHGGINPITDKYVTQGKRSPVWEDGSQYFEGEGNRDIVDKASSMLIAQGFNVSYTVPPNDYRDIPLLKRVEIANKLYLKNNKKSFLISVHSNGFRKESANGTEVFTSLGHTRSDIIATIWMQEFSKLFPKIKPRTDYNDGDIDKEAKFTIIQKTLCPGILIESMFHTNRHECRILLNPNQRKKIGKVICNTAVRAHHTIWNG